MTWPRRARRRASSIYWPTRAIKSLRFKFSCWITLAEFQNARGESRNTLTACSQMFLPYPFCERYITCPFRVVCGEWDFLPSLPWDFLKNGVKANWGFVKFAIKHLCDGFLYGEMVAWLNGNTECLFSFCLEVFDHQRNVSRKIWLIWNLWGNILERVTRIIESVGGVESTKFSSSFWTR